MIEKDIRRLINLVEEKSEDQAPKQLNESTGVTDYNPKSQGETRKELLAKYHKTKDPKDAEAARKAGATQQELKKGVAEGLDPDQRSKLDDLIDKYKDSVDPGYDSYGTDDHYDSDDIVAQIRSEFGDRIADQVEAGAEKMHFPRQGHQQGYDPLGWRKPIGRQTKAGKMFKQDSDYRKNMVKSRYKLSGKSATESMAEGIGKRCMQCGMKNCKCPGDSCKCKPIAGWLPGKGFIKTRNEAKEKSTTMESQSLIKQGIDKLLKR
jgi:hypothetical protein